MTKDLIMFKALFKQSFIETRRYIFETVSGIITLLLFFLGLFYGAKALVGGSAANLGPTLEALVVGYMLWALAIFMYFSIAQDLIQQAQLGTLEQLSMSPSGLGLVVLARTLAAMVFQLIIMAVLLLLMMAITGKWLHIDLLSILSIAVLTLMGVFGLSFILGSLALVFKKVQSALQITQMAFIGFIALPIAKFGWLKWTPLAWGNHLLKEVMIKEESLFSLPLGDVGFLAAHALIYFCIGMATFRYFEIVARKRGLLGHY